MRTHRVYALYGSSNSGKTSTLCCLIDILQKEAEKILCEHIGGSDYLAIFKYDGQNIGVVSQGDTVSQLKKNLDYIESQSDIIFCATRTKGETCTHVVDRYGEKLTWVQNAGIYNNKKNAYDNSAFIKDRNIGIAYILFKAISV